MPKKSTDRQQPADTGRDHQASAKPIVNSERKSDAASEKSKDDGAENERNRKESGPAVNGQHTAQSGEAGRERLKNFQKNRHKGWRDML